MQVITASRSEWIVPFTGLQPGQFRKLVTTVAQRGGPEIADGRRDRPWSLQLPVGNPNPKGVRPSGSTKPPGLQREPREPESGARGSRYTTDHGRAASTRHDEHPLWEFCASLLSRLDHDVRARCRRLVLELLHAAGFPNPWTLTEYEPRRKPTTARHATYSANLVCLTVLLSDAPVETV